MKKVIISQKLNEIRAAVINDNELEMFYSEREDNPNLIGNIYKGRVQNYLPGLQAAFVDIGRDKNVFLQTKENKRFSIGQSVLIQIEKNAIGTKGARATTDISLAGDYVVFLPTVDYIGVSHKLSSEEQERLHKFAKKICPSGSGLIIRTAARNCEGVFLMNELERLQKLWSRISERNNKRKPPALLYSVGDLIEKIVQVVKLDEVEIIFTDNLKVYRRLKETILSEKISLYEEKMPIFEKFNVNKDIEELDKRELPLSNGGQIIIDKTEALTVIDVNSNNFNASDFKETVLKTNLEAAEIIIKQLRLRDIKGIIVVDFITMIEDAHKNLLLNFLRECAKKDHGRTSVIDMTQLNLVEIVRHC